MAQVDPNTKISEPIPAIVRRGRPYKNQKSKIKDQNEGNGSGSKKLNGGMHAESLELQVQEYINSSGLVMPKQIVKRDGRVVAFDMERIESAIKKCFVGLGREPQIAVSELARQAVNIVAAKYAAPTVENVQDVVEMVLQAAGEFEAAKSYILYRAEHAKAREERPVPEEVKKAFEASDKYFPTPMQMFQFYDKYSRFNYDLGRRETWVETVDRAVSFLAELSQNRLPAATYERLRKFILEMKSAPSMRLLAMAGEAARRQNLAIYNCSYMPVDGIDSFVEALVISMSGCGVGFSVEGKYVENFPRVRRQSSAGPVKFVVEDTTEGWADALRFGLATWFDGGDVQFDYSLLRPAGAPLKTKGGRASGPAPFRDALTRIRSLILARQGSFLRPIDAHDIMCLVGNAAVSGGVRRTAMISLFDYEDAEMRFAKHGDFERENSQRWNSNNSVVLPERGLTQQEFMHLFMDMADSGRGEPGLFSRTAAQNMRPQRRQNAEFGTNPCGEIVLRPYELCNLSIAIARNEDNFESLREKVEVASIIGTIQSMATKFPGLRDKWRQNCEEERLLGVDINGQLDSPICWDRDVKERLLHEALITNRETAKQLGINPSVSVTCVKPSGNSSQLFNCSSGIHTRWAPYYIRNARVATHTPIYKVLRDAGVPMDPENGQTEDNANTWVVHFPTKSPAGAITRKDRTAIQQCEFWLQNKLHWTEHNPSVTITYYPHEIMDLMKWAWDHLDMIGGMTFLPAFDAQYAQMPYEEVSKEEYEALAARFPKIDFSKIYRYEEDDLTKAAQEIACMGGQCEVEYVPQADGSVKMQPGNGH